MSLQSVAGEVLAEYQRHVRNWQECLRQEFPHLPPGFGLDDVPDGDVDWYDEICDDRAFEAEALLANIMERIEAALVANSDSPEMNDAERS